MGTDWKLVEGFPFLMSQNSMGRFSLELSVIANYKSGVDRLTEIRCPSILEYYSVSFCITCIILFYL